MDLTTSHNKIIMGNIIINIDWEDNYGAWCELLPGCVAVSDSYDGIKKEIAISVDLHIKGMQEDGELLPEEFKDGYTLIFKMNIRALLHRYNGIFTNAALERITGINQKQLWNYANGLAKPRRAQIDKIENALHSLGNDLMSVVL